MSALNTNILAINTENYIQRHYARVAESVRRLSSGLRINGASDDAAGLAIRELMRSNVAALHQGLRNAHDAISMIQVADGALAIIDEKLIRMKELAEQAATGTYDSTQREMINSEFRAMADEIDRISNATDFNGIKLLDGSLNGRHDGSGLEAKGAMKIHFGSKNDSDEDYYYVDIGKSTTAALGLHDGIRGEPLQLGDGTKWLTQVATIDWDTNTFSLDVTDRIAGPGSPQGIPGFAGFDSYALPVGLKNVSISSENSRIGFAHKPHMHLFERDGTQVVGINPNNAWGAEPGHMYWGWERHDAAPADGFAGEVVNRLVANGILNPDAQYNGDNIINRTGQSLPAGGGNVKITAGFYDALKSQVWETMEIDEVSSDLAFVIGGHYNGAYCNYYNLKITGEITPELRAAIRGEDPPIKTSVLIKIDTQEKAQKALERVDNAIISKDKIRSHLGALQNRLENTISNLSIQSENLQVAESRISDVDVAKEMTTLVREQILCRSATAMLGQANTYPHMLMLLLSK